MLQDEKIRFQAYQKHIGTWLDLAPVAGFTPQQAAALKGLGKAITELARVVWKEEGELMKPPNPNA
jgi:hypothetical protein